MTMNEAFRDLFAADSSVRRLRAALCCSSAALAALAFNAAAHAQSDEASAGSQSDVIVVRAQRRESSIQDVPAAINVLSAAELEEALAFDTQALTMLSPSLVVSSAQSEAQGSQIRLRGIGTASGNLGLEGAIGVYVNGVYVPRTGIALNELVDVEQVEVLRGPQGTLFGKNTSAGAILFQSARPEFEGGGGATLQVGAGDQSGVKFARASGHINVPLVENELAFRLAGAVHQREGYVENVVTGEDVQNRDRFFVRASMLYEPPGSDTSVFAAIDYNEKDELCCAATPFINGARTTPIIASLGGPVVEAPSFDRVALNTSPTSVSDEIGVQFHLDHQFSWAEFTAILGYRNFSFDREQDLDTSPIDIFRRPSASFESEVISGEFLLNGATERVDWLFGAYIFDESLSERTDSRFGELTDEYLAQFIPPIAGLVTGGYPEGFGEVLNFDQQSDGWSVFTHNVVEITENLEFTAGLRYLEESKSGAGIFEQDSPPACSTQLLIDIGLGFSCPVNDFAEEFSDEEVVGTAALRYSFTDALSVYASYSTGFKSGGINFDRTAGGLGSTGGVSPGQTFAPETVESIELGLRSEWWDRRVRLNATYFHMDIRDLQVNVFDGTTFFVGNRGEVTSEGVEIDAALRLAEGLNVSGGVTYADVTDGDTGEQIPFAPEWAGTFGVSYERELTESLVGRASLNARYTGDQVLGGDNDPIKTQGAYTLVNGRIGLAIPASNLEISLFASNLLDEEYALIIGNATLQPGTFNQFPGVPRLFGVEISKGF